MHAIFQLIFVMNSVVVILNVIARLLLNGIYQGNALRKVHVKLNVVYSSAYRIPECNRDYQKSSSDLYLGLRIAYNVRLQIDIVSYLKIWVVLQIKTLCLLCKIKN